MAKGGARKGAGRKAGGSNKKTREIADKAAAEGITPLEVMIDNMRFFHEQSVALRGQLGDDAPAVLVKAATDARLSAQECAKDAAPYMHPRLAAIEHTGKDGQPIQHNVTLQDTEMLKRFGVKL